MKHKLLEYEKSKKIHELGGKIIRGFASKKDVYNYNCLTRGEEKINLEENSKISISENLIVCKYCYCALNKKIKRNI